VQQDLLDRKALQVKLALSGLRGLPVKLALLARKVLLAKPESPALRAPPAACSTKQISMR